MFNYFPELVKATMDERVREAHSVRLGRNERPADCLESEAHSSPRRSVLDRLTSIQLPGRRPAAAPCGC